MPATRKVKGREITVIGGQTVDVETGEILTTARNTRPVLETGSVNDTLALFPNRDDIAALVRAKTVTAGGGSTEADPATRLEPIDPILVRYPDRHITQIRAHLKPLVAFLNAQETEAKEERARQRSIEEGREATTKKGRTPRLTFEALLVGFWLAANSQRPMLFTVVSEILFHGLYPTAKNLLDVSDGANPRPRNINPQNQWNRTSTKAVRDLFHRMLDLLDPSDLPWGRNFEWADLDDPEKDLRRGISPEDATRLQALLDWVTCRIIQISVDTLDPTILDRWDGSVGIDGSHIRIPATGRTLDDTQASAAAWAAYYIRDADHGDPDRFSTTIKKFRRNTTKRYWANELHLLVATDPTPGDKQWFPSIVPAMTMQFPAVDPSGAARRLFASMKERDYTPGFLTGDGLYSNADAAKYQIPARETGYRLLLAINTDQSGLQQVHPSGMHQVDGTYYAPCIASRPELVTALADLRARRIDLKTFGARTRERIAYEMRTKQKPDADLNGERLTCPAAGPVPLVKCLHKPESMDARETTPVKNKRGKISKIDTRITVTLPEDLLTDGELPGTCRQNSVTVSKTDGAKYRQAMPVGDKHTDIYNRLRQSQEGFHGFAKDEAKEALGSPGRRLCKRGAAQQLFAAFLIAAANLRKIASFTEKAVRDPETGYLYVPRHPRKGDHARTGNPPGAPPLAA